MNEIEIKKELMDYFENAPIFNQLEYKESLVNVEKTAFKYNVNVSLSACFLNSKINRLSEDRLDKFFKEFVENLIIEEDYFKRCDLELIFQLYSKRGINISRKRN